MRKDARLTMKTNQVQDYVLNWGRIFESRTDDEQHHACETILVLVQKAPEHIQWTISKHNKEEICSWP